MADDYEPDADLAKEGRELFAAAESAETDNRETYLKDISFAREGKQWDDAIVKQRLADKRPMLTINKLPTVIRQVVNDARQNKPSIKVHPVDSGADKDTAEVINGLIRNIETTSNADIAYDTATECAVAGGFGYLRVGLDYAYEDSFEMDLSIQRISNPLSVYGDPNSTAADSSDWNDAFIVDQIPEEEFKAEYKGKAAVDFEGAAWSQVKDAGWRNQETKTVQIAEWWCRKEYEKEIVLCNDGQVYGVEDVEKNPDLMALFNAGVLQVKQTRTAKCHKVYQRTMSGAEVIKERDWPGKYIPIIPVYGEEFDIEGKRIYRSLIHNAIDAQRMYNYWRTTATELVALAPRVPFIGPVGSFASDERWQTVNINSHPYIEYDNKGVPPQRMPLDGGVAAGALQEALNAADDIKATTGLFDASLGMKSNETSGKAIMARQREGDVSTFHFMDNMARAIRHTGRIIIDLIPHVYNTERIIRVIGEDGTPEAKPINQQYPNPQMGPDGKPLMEPDPSGQMVQKVVMAMHDLRVGKYDLTVSTGPSFTTRREEAAYQMTELIRAMPDMAPVVAPELAKNLDWPGADKIAEKMEAMQSGQLPPEAEKAMADLNTQVQQLTQENQQLKMDNTAEMQKAQADIQVEEFKTTKQIELETFKVQSQVDLARQKAAADAAIAQQKVNTEREHGATKIRNERDLAAMKDDGVEVDEGGKKVVKSGVEVMMQGLEMLGRLISDGQKTNQQSLEQIARIVAAPNELMRDPKTNKATGSRKVLQ